MSVRKVDIAAALGMSRQMANHWFKQGMPEDSIEAASAWYEARKASGERRGGSAPAREPVNDESFAQIVEQHRSLKQRAYEKYLDDLQGGTASEQSKSYATYDKLLKTMVALEREAQARDLASRRLVETSVATQTFGKVLLAVRNEMTQMPQAQAAKANPDNPRLALKVMEQAVHAILGRLSNQAVEAIEAISAPAEPVTVTDLPEPEEKSDGSD